MTVDATTAGLLRQDFDLPQGSLTEAELLDWLSKRVAELLRDRPEYFMSLCYTLDLDQAAVAHALELPSGSPTPAGSIPAAPHKLLARLLYERQCARARTKHHYHPPTLDDKDAW